MSGTIFKKYGNPLKIFKAPDWDKPYEPQTKWGELASSITEILNLIEQAAEVFRKNKPKSEKEIICIEQSTGYLEIKIRGGVNTHKELSMEVTEKTLQPIMRILNSIRDFKTQLEKLSSREEARELYHEVMNASRYLDESEETKVKGHSFDTSGGVILEGTVLISPEIKAENVFSSSGYVFAGDEPRERHKSYIDEILATLRNLMEKEPERIIDKHKAGNVSGEDSTERQNLMAITIIPKYFDVTEKTLRRRTGEGKRFKNYPDADGIMRLDTTVVAQYYARLTDSKTK
ncbi:MAG: hypothetical protein GY774_14450 [Planctomycetes bacterium]|nr:hypothetical protein [Planctomycetota bacterium]